MSDKWDTGTAGLLPCTNGKPYCDYINGELRHGIGCPAYYRAAVAAAFREHMAEAEQRIRILENPRVTNDDFRKVAEIQNEQMKLLQAEAGALRKQVEQRDNKINALRDKLAAAEVEALRDFRSEMRKCPDLDERDCIRVELFLDDFIAARERGKGE